MKFCPSIDSVDIKYAICGRINCIPLQRKGETRPFRPRAGDVIHPSAVVGKGSCGSQTKPSLPDRKKGQVYA